MTAPSLSDPLWIVVVSLCFMALTLLMIAVVYL